MSYTIRILPDEPIVIETLHSDFNLATEGGAAEAEMTALLESLQAPVYVIFDLHETSFGLDDLIAGANMLTRGVNDTAPRRGKPFFSHPNVRQLVMVSASPVIQLAAKGMNSPIFGHRDIKVVSTQEQALDYCRAV